MGVCVCVCVCQRRKCFVPWSFNMQSGNIKPHYLLNIEVGIQCTIAELQT